MTQEEKQLLLKDLCARVPYRTFVCLNPGAYNKPEKCILTGVHGEKVHLNVDSDPFRVDHIKPYLRPMSSMTEEEFIQFGNDTGFGMNLHCSSTNGKIENIWLDEGELEDYYKFIDWLNKHHFDYRRLIEKGLALEAPEGMYETK